MNTNFAIPKNYGDNIQNLPSDENEPTNSEIQIIDSLFKEKTTAIQLFLANSKELIFLCVLFIIMSLPQIENLILNFFPNYNNQYVIIIIKAVAFSSIYFVLKNLYLVRK
jgi:hypothetical protein